MTSPTASTSSRRIYVACTAEGQGPAIHLVEMNANTGALKSVSSCPDGGKNLFYAELDRAKRRLYAADIIGEFDGRPGGAVHAYAIDPATGALTYLNGQNTIDTVPCYVSLSGDGKFAIVAGYGSGLVSMFPIDGDGKVGRAASSVSQADSGGKSQARAHSVVVDPSGKYAYSADLGVDRIMMYRIDTKAGALLKHEQGFLPTKKGAGPRHLAWHPSGKFLFAQTEYDNTMIAMAFDAATGRLTEIQVEPTLPKDFTTTSYGADVQVHPSGKFVYGSNRGHDSLAAFAIAPDTGRISLIGQFNCGGKFPNAFRIDPAGRFIVVANTNTHQLATLAIDAATGKVSDTSHRLEIKKPAGLTFL